MHLARQIIVKVGIGGSNNRQVNQVGLAVIKDKGGRAVGQAGLNKCAASSFGSEVSLTFDFLIGCTDGLNADFQAVGQFTVGGHTDIMSESSRFDVGDDRFYQCLVFGPGFATQIDVRQPHYAFPPFNLA